MPGRPVRPPGWKEAHRVGLVQPCSREAVIGQVHVRIPSILADARRTYVELRWKSPIIGARFFAERVELYDPFGKLITRRAELDAGDRAERFLCFGAIPTAATQVVLKIFPSDGSEAVALPLRIEPRVRGRGAFSVPVGTSVMLAGRRLEVVRYHGGVTEGVVEVRVQSGPCSWPLTLQAGLAGRTLAAEAAPDDGGRAHFELEVEEPPAGSHALQPQAVVGLLLDEPLTLELGAGEQKHPRRMAGGRLLLETLPRASGDGAHVLRLRMPHTGLSENVMLTEFTRHALSDTSGQPIVVDDIRTTRWPAGTEQEIIYRSQTPAAVLHLDGMAWRFDPPPSIRLAQA
jgi:hypothetical protein